MKTTSASVAQRLLAGLLALPLLAMSSGAHADEAEGRHPALLQGGPGKLPGGPYGSLPPLGAQGPGVLPPFLHGLELTSAQQDQVFAILHAQAPYLYEQGKAATLAHEGLRGLARAEQYDDGKAVALAKDAGNAMANLALQGVRTEQKLLAVLSLEQRKKLASQALQPHVLWPHAVPPQGRP